MRNSKTSLEKKKMKKLFKFWWFRLIMLLQCVALVLFLIDKEFCAALWLCTATYWFVSYLLENEENHDLRMDNIKLTIHLLETTQMLAEKTLEDKEDEK
jgi:hypothetical protein